MLCFFILKKLHVHVVRQDFVLNLETKDMTCKDCNHSKGDCDCLCCCSISKIGCPTCVVPVLAYRGIKKLIRKMKTKS